MNFNQIETERLILRKFLPSDAADMFKNYCNSENVCRFMPWSPHENIEATKEYLQTVLNSYNDKESNRLDLAIVLKEIGQVVGSISISRVNLVDNNCDLGFCIGENFWGKGITSEAGKALIKFVFENTPIERIQARHIKENIGSGKVMEKIGMDYEGTFRHSVKFKDGNYVDMAYRSIIREDYERGI